MTRQRELIYNIIKEKPVHLTAEEIHERAASVMPGIALGTVYRNLGLMTSAGQIQRVDCGDGVARYDRQPAPHAHLLCVRCGELRDIDMPGLLAQLRASCGEAVTTYELKLYYCCKQCQMEEQKNG